MTFYSACSLTRSALLSLQKKRHPYQHHLIVASFLIFQDKATMRTAPLSRSGGLLHLTTILAALAVYLLFQGCCYGLAIAAPYKIARSPSGIIPLLENGSDVLEKR